MDCPACGVRGGAEFTHACRVAGGTVLTWALPRWMRPESPPAPEPEQAPIPLTRVVAENLCRRCERPEVEHLGPARWCPGRATFRATHTEEVPP